jgi:RNA-directed DNA polymerase
LAKFLDLKSLDDLAIFLGYPSYEKLKGLIYPELSYLSFQVPKKSGGFRIINSPGLKLKQLQQLIAPEIRDAYGKRSPIAHSFIPKRSIVTNALPHLSKASVVRVDLTDFFGNINFGRIKGIFLAAPFEFEDDVATVLAHICCYENKLPQGAPTSAPITNFICLSLDRRISLLAKRYKGRATRYSDDITFSFKSLPLEKLPKELFEVSKSPNGQVIVAAGRILTSTIEDEGFTINASKTKGANKNQRQLITGLIVNKHLTVPRKYIDGVRRAIHIWHATNPIEAEKRCVNFLSSRHYASGTKAAFVPLLRGKLNFLSMVTGRSGSAYQRLASDFNRLMRRDFPGDSSELLKIDTPVKTNQDAVRATWHLISDEYVEGTAFRFVDNIWVTCAHCIGSIATKTIYGGIKLSSGDWSSADLDVRVVSVDWDRDLAILRPKPLQAIPRHLPYFVSAKALPAQDDRVGVMGFPSPRPGQPPIFMRARILRCRSKKGISRIEIDKQVLKGNSGGPLFNEDYQVLGVVVEGAAVIVKEDTYDHGENACISISELSTLDKL